MLKRRIGVALELEKPDHQSALLRWLRQWGCRHLSRASDPTASAALRTWAEEWVPLLPQSGKTLADLSRDDIMAVAVAYGQLADTVAGQRRAGRTSCACYVRAHRSCQDDVCVASERLRAVGRSHPSRAWLGP
jgi:hypothetical protein